MSTPIFLVGKHVRIFLHNFSKSVELNRYYIKFKDGQILGL